MCPRTPCPQIWEAQPDCSTFFADKKKMKQCEARTPLPSPPGPPDPPPRRPASLPPVPSPRLSNRPLPAAANHAYNTNNATPPRLHKRTNAGGSPPPERHLAAPRRAPRRRGAHDRAARLLGAAAGVPVAGAAGGRARGAAAGVPAHPGGGPVQAAAGGGEGVRAAAQGGAVPRARLRRPRQMQAGPRRCALPPATRSSSPRLHETRARFFQAGGPCTGSAAHCLPPIPFRPPRVRVPGGLVRSQLRLRHPHLLGVPPLAGG